MRICQQEDINFLLTNRIPRRLATQAMGRLSKIEHPLVRTASMALWRLFSDVDLSDAKETEFRSLHACFTRELKEGARPVDRRPDILVSPCDAIIGTCGTIAATRLFQVKGFPYRLEDLLIEPELIEDHRNGRYVTLRLTSGMYHRFHAPHDCHVERVVYISGDTWNVNPIALRRIEKLFCKNERAVLRTRIRLNGEVVTMVAVAAILVGGIRLRFIEEPLRSIWGRANVHLREIRFEKGEQIGWFEHGSTMLVFAPDGLSLCDRVREGQHIRVGQPLMRLP
jgi:phosphatidylserine decarboxylase